MKNIRKLSFALMAFAIGLAQKTFADEVLDWNAVAGRSIVASGASGLAQARWASIVQASVFDAVNGVDRQFTPLHVVSQAPSGASPRAAAVYAAYTALVTLMPAQRAAFDQDLATSLAGIAAAVPAETSDAIARGRAWGEQVANEIVTWRSTDGFDPSPSNYQGSQDPGKWRPTPPANATSRSPAVKAEQAWAMARSEEEQAPSTV